MIKNILSQNAFWQVNKAIARATSIEAALLLSDLIDKHTYHSEKNELKERNGAWYFFATADAIELNTTLSYHKQKKVLEVLEQFGLIKTLLMGNPAKLHFSICEREILAVLKAKDAKSVLEKFENKYSKNSKTSIEENGKQVLEKTQNYSINNRDIKNRINKSDNDVFSKNQNFLDADFSNAPKEQEQKKESHTGPETLENYFEQLDNDQFTFTYCIENIGISESDLKNIWIALTKAFKNQIINDEKQYTDFKAFAKHFKNYAFIKIPFLLKNKNSANGSNFHTNNANGSKQPFKSKEQVRDEYNRDKDRKFFDNIEAFAAQI